MGLIFFTIVISVIGLIIFSNGEDTSKNEVVSKKSDDEDFYKDDRASSFSSDDDSSSIHFINPASGAPMIGDGTDGVDTMGNVFGTDDMFSSDDTFHHTDV